MKIVNTTRLFNGMLVSLLLILFNSNLTAQDFDCLDCHDDVIENSVHFENIECADCHTDVEDEDHADDGAAKVNCADCHDEYAELQKKNIHHRLKREVKNPPTCTTCHGSHEVFSPSTVRNKVRTYCSNCHDNIVMAQNYHTVASSNEECIDCHNPELFIPPLEKSVHNELLCADCHNYISHNLDDHPAALTKLQHADCYLCHNDVAKIHRESIHGISIMAGVNEAAQCWDCHSAHDITHVTEEDSPVNPLNIPATCGNCHNNEELIAKYNIAPMSASKNYESSVHGQIVAEGGNAATCSSCHGIHDIKARIEPNSKINVFNVPDNCGQCHEEISDEYKQSIHWIRAKKGVRNSPVCTDCHSEHGIEVITKSADTRAEIKRMQEEKCIGCHSSTRVPGGNGGQALQYQDSYHGLAVMGGSEKAAMCIDCHNVHKILPARHPESTVNKDNVTATCQTCHPDATPVFANSYSHSSSPDDAKWIEDLVTNIYIWMIILVIGGMILHNLLIFFREIKDAKKKESNEIRIPRFTRNEVIQHFLLLISFIVLAITGFALKFPDNIISTTLIDLGLTEEVRRIVHRISAFVMMGVGLYHIYYTLATARGRDVLLSLLPKFEDIKAAGQSILYYLKLSDKKPDYNQYDYAEKAEYWALIWGTLIMGITGLFLMYPTWVGDWAPVWFVKVCEIIHFYEAILATLAIIVWHWFFVIFRPSAYPMSFAWIDGKMTLHNYSHHHKNNLRSVFLELTKLREEKIKEDELSNYANLVKQTITDEGHDINSVMDEYFIEDPEMKVWIKDNID
jgi:predicted CXXCH cytochrome family protein